MEDLHRLSDSELTNTLDEVVRLEQRHLFEVVRVLAEFEERRTYLKLGFRSSFEYLTKHLGYSEAAATRRIRAAKAARVLPEVVECVEAGEVTFSAVETCSELLIETGGKLVLEALKGKTIEEAKILKASSRGSSRESRDVISPIVSFAPVGQKEIEFEKTADLTCNRSGFLDSDCEEVAAPKERTEEKTEQKHRISFTAGVEFMKKFERVKELKFRGEAISLEEMFGEALDMWLEKKAPERRIARRNAQKADSTSHDVNSRYVPVALRDRVLERDGFQCSFVSEDGRRCSCREDLEIDHRRPVAFGGKTEIGNLRTLCRAHNGHAWEVARAEVFGH